MRNMMIGLFGAMTLAGCAPGSVHVDGECDDCDNQANWRIELTAEEVGDSATLTIEFLEREDQVGQLGWHLTLDCPDDIRLSASPEELQNMLDDRGYNVVVENVECVRWNVNYDNGRDLCEGNDYTPYDAELIADTDLNWSGERWVVDTWSDPSGEGCSAVACSP